MVRVEMPTDPRSSLPDEGRWLEEVGRILADLGFELTEAGHSGSDETSHLFVALRPKPTLQHFDPEKIDYWVSDGVRGRAAQLDREGRFPLTTDYAWGRITLTDRLGVGNEFLSFGGTLRAQMAPDATVFIDFSSDAPILRWSGHSQASDPLAAEVGAFFARMMVPIDFAPGAEALISKAAPLTLYCAYIQFMRERLTRAGGLRDSNSWLAEWGSRESQRMEAGANDRWKAAAELRGQLAAMEATARK
jgi:hypothetical protein